MQCCPVCRAHLRLPAAWRHPVVRPDSDRQLLAHPPVSAEPAGATRAARPFRSLQAGGFHASDRSDSPKPRQRVRRRLAGAPAAACRSRA
nr:hypothetical protein [Escherichia coli]